VEGEKELEEAEGAEELEGLEGVKEVRGVREVKGVEGVILLHCVSEDNPPTLKLRRTKEGVKGK